MASNSMSSTLVKLQSVDCYLIGSTRITRSQSRADYDNIVLGLTLWIGILLDHNSWTCCKASTLQAVAGRIYLDAVPIRHGVCRLDIILGYLDDCMDELFTHLSSYDQFKADHFLEKILSKKVPDELRTLKGLLVHLVSCSIVKQERGECSVLDVIKWLRQDFGFLKKLDVARPDIQDATLAEFHSYEEYLADMVVDQRRSEEYQCIVAAMNKLLRNHVEYFTMDRFSPKHGPGAVADSSVKSWYTKCDTMKQDRRMAYLLRKHDLGSESEYAPGLLGEHSDRTSRFICVPKSWKKLRGISAEPTELQFWQQGVLSQIDKMFRHDKWWRCRVNLHDQSKSQELALIGSLSDFYATIDLSSASDSVTLQLVKDVFKGTPLLPWLLACRSTHTECGGVIRRIAKFAPMGSACCFPVECIVFALAAEVACARGRIPSLDEPGRVCVYGDDIIIPHYGVEPLLGILSVLGFKVNTEKSYWAGNFREACGVEAWRGHDITPARYQRVTGVVGHGVIQGSEVSAAVDLANRLYWRGLHESRKFLLGLLLKRKIPIGRRTRTVQDTLFATFSGEGSSLASPMPTNFSLMKRFDRHLQTISVRRVIWRIRPIVSDITAEMAQKHSVYRYTEWLMQHQQHELSEDVTPELRIDSSGCQVSDNVRLPIGMVMVPTEKWVIPRSHDWITGISSWNHQ